MSFFDINPSLSWSMNWNASLNSWTWCCVNIANTFDPDLWARFFVEAVLVELESPSSFLLFFFFVLSAYKSQKKFELKRWHKKVSQEKRLTKVTRQNFTLSLTHLLFFFLFIFFSFFHSFSKVLKKEPDALASNLICQRFLSDSLHIFIKEK